MTTASRTLAALGRGEPLDEAWAHLDALVKARAWSEVGQLFAALEAWSGPAWLAEAAARRLACAVALADHPDAARVLVHALAGRAEGRWGRASAMAEALAEGARADVLCALLPERHLHVELFARWMHGLVARGCDLSTEPSCAVFQDELAERGHLLGTVPLAPAPFEATYSFPRSVTEVSLIASVMPLVHVPDGGPLPAVRFREPVPSPSSALRASDPGALFKAVRAWSRHEAVVLTFAEPVVGTPGPQAFSALPFPPSSGASLRLQPASPEAVAAWLFAAAAWGGASGRGEGSGPARVSVAASIGAMVAQVPPVDWERLAVEASEARWWLFLGTPWFADIAWDLGVACLRKDGETMVLLAATDTD